MNKTLRYLFLALMAMTMGHVSADNVTDVLTWESLGLDGSGNSYKEYTDIKATSNAVYAAQASSGTAQYIQLRSNNNNSGIVTTASGGKLKSVTITFNAKTTDRKVQVYAKNEAYTAATDLYSEATQGTLLKEIAANDESKTLTVEGDYAFVGLRSASGALYVDKIEITWAGAAGGGSQSQDVKVGIERPTFTAEDGTVTYDMWNYIETTDKFNKSADGLTVKFFQSTEIEATIVKDETQEGGYEVKNVCHQGVKNIPLDYVWKLNCADYDGSLKRHKNETLGSENWQFGFDLTVAEGKTFSVSAIDFDLLVEQNPTYRIRIMKGDTEVYNSTWITKTGGYNNEAWGAGSYCRITSDDVSFLFEKKDAEGNAINYQAIQYYPGFEDGVGVKTPLGSLKLEAGTYRVVADVDFNKDSSKAMSFDNFSLEGTLEGGSGSGESEGDAGFVGIVRPTFTAEDGTVTYDTWNYIETTDKFNKSADGLTVKFFQSTEIEATIVKDETQEGGYEVKNVCHQGVKNIPLDYVWKLNCADYDGSLKRHKNETLGSENWQFGFDLTVADGKAFTVSAIDFDLLVEQNPAYRIRIMKGETEVYNSTWITKTGGYNNEAWGAGSYCRITKDDVSFLFEKKDAEGNAINYQAIQYYPGFEDGVGTKTPLGDLVLNAGTYRVVADVDFNKDSAKALSFDNFTLEGSLADATSVETIKTVVKTDGTIYNLAGQKVGKDYKGIVIMNGKKFMQK